MEFEEKFRKFKKKKKFPPLFGLQQYQGALVSE